MAAITYYLADFQAGGWQEITDAGSQPAATITTGWVVGTGSTNHSALAYGIERASSTFTNTTPPDGSLDSTLHDAFRSSDAHSGIFASGNWVFHGVVRAITNGGQQDGRIRFRLFKADADGSNATEITSGQQSASIVTNVSTSADFDSSLTFNPGSFSINNQYIFFQIAWERTGAGQNTNSDIHFRTGSSSSAGTRIVTSSFTVTEVQGFGSMTVRGTQAAALNARSRSLSMMQSGPIPANVQPQDINKGHILMTRPQVPPQTRHLSHLFHFQVPSVVGISGVGVNAMKVLGTQAAVIRRRESTQPFVRGSLPFEMPPLGIGVFGFRDVRFVTGNLLRGSLLIPGLEPPAVVPGGFTIALQQEQYGRHFLQPTTWFPVPPDVVPVPYLFGAQIFQYEQERDLRQLDMVRFVPVPANFVVPPFIGAGESTLNITISISIPP